MERQLVMMRFVLWIGVIGAAALEQGFAQDAKTTAPPASVAVPRDVPLPVAAPGDTVVIKREAVAPVDPQKYRTSLYLMPIRTLTLVAPTSGIVRGLAVKTGQPLQAQTEAVRLDNTTQKLRLKRAQALYKVAVLEMERLAASAEQKELMQARVDAAKAEVELAEYELELASIRMPFAGEVLRFLVSEGQFVKAGDPVAQAGDTLKLQVEIPVERSQVVEGKSFPLKIEGEEVEAQVQAVLPLDPKFDPLRDLFDSLASAVVVIDNAKRRFQPGQTVHVPLIPRHPVAEVPSGAVANRSDGGRKVQVLRNDVVRDVPVVLMGSVGVDRLFVSGPFAPGDEVIFESSHQLGDGFPVKAATAKARRTDGTAGSPAAEPKGSKKPTTDF
jgi:RND family efflux transporter MFP subunit